MDVLQEKGITKIEFKKLSSKIDALSGKLEAHDKNSAKQHTEQVQQHLKTHQKVDSVSIKFSEYFGSLSEQLKKNTDISAQAANQFRAALMDLQKNVPADISSYEEARDRLYAIYDHDRASSCYALMIRLDLEKALESLEEPIKQFESKKGTYKTVHQNATLANFLDSANILTEHNYGQPIWTKIQRDGIKNRMRLHDFIHYDSDFKRKSPDKEIEDLNQSMRFFRDKGLISFGKIKLKPIAVPQGDVAKKNAILHSGTVLQYFVDRGFGFIEDKTVGGVAYMHISQFLSKEIIPSVGLEVEFETQPPKKENGKPQAIKVKLANTVQN